MGEKEILRAIEADAGRPGFDGQFRIGRVVDVGQEFNLDAVGRDGLLVAVLDKPIAHVDEFALQLAIGRLRLGIGLEVHVSFPAVENEEIAGLHLPQDATQAGHRGDSQRPSQDGRVPGAAPRFGNDSSHVQLFENEGLRGQNLRRHHDDRFVADHGRAFLRLIQGELSDYPAHDVADVGQALLEVFIRDVGEQGYVLAQNFVQGGAGIDLFFQDNRLDLGDERRIAQ